MKKSTLALVTKIFLVLALILTIILLFYRPTFDTKGITFFVNVKDSKSQPIFADKKFGITKFVTADFKLKADTINADKAYLKEINLESFRLSGLRDYGFIHAVYLEASNNEPDTLLMIMSLWGRKTIPVHMPPNGVPIDINGISNFVTLPIYPDDGLKKLFECTGDYNEILKCIKSKDFGTLNVEGRICNVSCIHE
ncbi:MAG: hypothetical protein AAFX55_18620 [Bacteroidota bacterium]